MSIRRSLDLAAYVFVGLTGVLSAQMIAVTGSYPGIAAGDVNADGYADTMVIAGGQYEVQSGRDGAVFAQLTRPAPSGFFGSYKPMLGDVDADGCDDLLFNTGSLNWNVVSGAQGSALFVVSAESFLEARDLDGDGHDDIWTSVILPMGSTASILHRVISGRDQTVVGQFNGSFDFLTRTALTFRWAGDADGDGAEDVLEVLSFLPNVVSRVLYAQGTPASINGRLFPIGDFDGDLADDFGFQSAGALPDGVVRGRDLQQIANLMPVDIGPFDLDGDGYFDVVAEDLVVPDFHIVSGRTLTAFPGTMPRSNRPPQNVGDLNADGRSDFERAGSLYELVGGAAAPLEQHREPRGITNSMSRPTMGSRGAARIGGVLHPDLHGALAGQPAFLAWGSAANLDLGPSGAPGNRALIFLGGGALLVPTNARGFARVPLVIPNDVTLLGVRLSLQWAVLDGAANALGLVTSNALDLTVGT